MMSTDDDHNCIWRKRAEAMFDLTNAALRVANVPVLERKNGGDFLIISATEINKLRKLAEKYRALSANEAKEGEVFA